MSLILNIETATELCSIGLSRDAKMVAQEESGASYDHAAAITLLIEDCFRAAGLAPTDLDAVAVSRGPGSYTALRIGASTAKGICYALDKPLIGVDTLLSLALASRREDDPPSTLYCPLIDARRMEVYAAVFDRDLRPVEAPQALVVTENSFGEYFSRGGPVVFSGNGSAKCRPFFAGRPALFREAVCAARHLAPLAHRLLAAGRLEDPAYFNPFYLKPPNITTPKRIL